MTGDAARAVVKCKLRAPACVCVCVCVAVALRRRTGATATWQLSERSKRLGEASAREWPVATLATLATTG